MKVSAMSGKLAALAAACLLANNAAAADAGSNVSIYGRISAGLNYVNKVSLAGGGQGSLTRFQSNEYGTSWWGIKGSETLDEDLSAVFNLESFFMAGNGVAPVGLFSRYAVVGLSSKRYGTLLAGRAMALTDSDMYWVDPMGMQTGGIANLVYGRNWGARSNALTYTSPTLGGYTLRLQTGLGEKAGDQKADRQLSASLNYVDERVAVRAVYEELRDGNGHFSSLYGASREYALGATYQLGDVRLYGGYSELRSDDATVADANNATASNRHRMVWTGLNWNITPTWQLVTGVYGAKLNRQGGGATLASLGVNYSLSKRTTLYFTVENVANRGPATYSVIQAGGISKPVPGGAQQGTHAGVMHYF